MSQKYVLVNKDNNKIKIGPTALPTTWRDPETNFAYDLTTLTDAQLLELNWKPYISTGPTEIGTYDSHISTSISFTSTTVNATNTIVSFNLEDTQEVKLREIDSKRDSMINEGVYFGGIEFDSDELAQKNIDGAVSSVTIRQSMGIPVDPIPWTTVDNSMIPLEGTEIVQFGLNLAEFVSTCYQTGRIHKNEILNKTTVADVINYDHLTSWPSNNLGGTISYLQP